jgi:hypothetical protein
MISATVRTSPQFEVVDRRVLFTNGDYVSDPTHQGYDVAPDGQHFAMVRHLSRSSSFMVLLHAIDVLSFQKTNR